MRTNPNASVGGATGALGVLVTWLLGHYHVSLSAEDGAAIATGCATVALWVGKDGVRGILRTVWRGKHDPPLTPPAA